MVWLSRDLLSPQCQQCHGYYRSDRGDRPPCLRSIATENHARFRGFAVSAESAVSQVSLLCLRMGQANTIEADEFCRPAKRSVVSAESAVSLIPLRCPVAPSRSICDRVSSISVFSSNKLNSPTNRPTKHCRLLANHCELLRTIIDHESRVNQGYFELHRTTANHSAADTASATTACSPAPIAPKRWKP